MKGLQRYYVSRALVSAVFGVVFWLSGATWWVAILMGCGVFALFLWAPHSGRYAVHPELGVTAMRRDEHTQAINDKAARNAFVVTMLVTGGVAIYFGSVTPAVVPLSILEALLVIGALTYFISDFWLRRS